MQSSSPSTPAAITLLTADQVRAIIREEIAAANTQSGPSYYTIDEAARELRCSVRQTWRLISLGQLAAVKLAGKRLITAAEIARYKREAV